MNHKQMFKSLYRQARMAGYFQAQWFALTKRNGRKHQAWLVSEVIPNWVSRETKYALASSAVQAFYNRENYVPMVSKASRYMREMDLQGIDESMLASI